MNWKEWDAAVRAEYPTSDEEFLALARNVYGDDKKDGDPEEGRYLRQAAVARYARTEPGALRLLGELLGSLGIAPGTRETAFDPYEDSWDWAEYLAVGTEYDAAVFALSEEADANLGQMVTDPPDWLVGLMNPRPKRTKRGRSFADMAPEPVKRIDGSKYRFGGRV